MYLLPFSIRTLFSGLHLSLYDELLYDGVGICDLHRDLGVGWISQT